MKKLLILLVSLVIFIFGGCQSLASGGQGDIADKPAVNLPVIPEEDDSIERKKTYILINASSLRVRSGAGTNYTAIGSVEKNDMLSYQGQKGSYYITTYKEKQAFVHKDYCTLVEFELSSDKI